MASAEAGVAPLKVQVCYSPAPRVVDQVSLELPAGSTVADALRASGLLERHGITLQHVGLSVGIRARLQPLDGVLRDADRVEIYRGLCVDPKEARRLRYRKQPAQRR